MFKVGLDLPSEVVKEPASSSKKKKTKSNAKLSGNELQEMMNELKKDGAAGAKAGSKSGSKHDSNSASKQGAKQGAKAGSAQKRAADESTNETIGTATKGETGAGSAGSAETKEKKRKKSAQTKPLPSASSQPASGTETATDSKSHSVPAERSANKRKVKKATEERPKDRKAEHVEHTKQIGQAPAAAPADSSRPLANAKKLTPLQLKMQQKLSGARFRWINEQLYTSDSAQAFDIFQKQPEVFKEYHDGFRHQVEQWPENPVISFVQQFKDRLVKPLNAPGGLPGDKAANEVVVADMGCGEAELALKLQERCFNRRRTHFEVHSFDMNAANERITVADIAHVPLPDESCHVVVFCLALMGTNLADFINEGIRILKPHGLVWIAEIKSRFENNDFDAFVATLKNMGLYHRTTDDSNKMFVKFEFIKLPHKLERAKEKNPEINLKPCIYKRR